MKWNSCKAKVFAASTFLTSGLAMAGPDLGAAEQQATNWHAIIMFVIFVGLTLFITKWAAKQTQSTQDFYTAGGVFRVSRTVWRLLVTSCLLHRSWVFLPWCSVQDSMVCCTH